MSDEPGRLCLSEIRRATTKRALEFWGDPDTHDRSAYALSVFVYAGNVSKLVRNAARGDRVNEARIAAELARTLVALDLLASRCGVDLAAATVETFNRDTVALEDRYPDVAAESVRLKLATHGILYGAGCTRANNDDDPADLSDQSTRRTGLLSDDDGERLAHADALAERFGRGPSRWFFRRYFALRHEDRMAVSFGIVFAVMGAGALGNLAWSLLRWILER